MWYILIKTYIGGIDVVGKDDNIVKKYLKTIAKIFIVLILGVTIWAYIGDDIICNIFIIKYELFDKMNGEETENEETEKYKQKDDERYKNVNKRSTYENNSSTYKNNSSTYENNSSTYKSSNSTYSGGYTPESSSKSSEYDYEFFKNFYDSDPYDVYDYDDAEDFYYDNYDDFDSLDDAEDYFDEAWG